MFKTSFSIIIIIIIIISWYEWNAYKRKMKSACGGQLLFLYKMMMVISCKFREKRGGTHWNKPTGGGEGWWSVGDDDDAWVVCVNNEFLERQGVLI